MKKTTIFTQLFKPDQRTASPLFLILDSGCFALDTVTPCNCDKKDVTLVDYKSMTSGIVCNNLRQCGKTDRMFHQPAHQNICVLERTGCSIVSPYKAAGRKPQCIHCQTLERVMESGRERMLSAIFSTLWALIPGATLVTGCLEKMKNAVLSV